MTMVTRTSSILLAALAICCHVAHARAVDGFEAREFASTNGATLKYRIHKPDNLEGKKTCPLVLMLHGRGHCGDDNTLQVQKTYGPLEILAHAQTNRMEVIIIAPQVPRKGWWGGPTMQMTVELMIESIDTLPVDTNMIYVTGLSMGGFGTWSIIQRYPDLFAAAIPICGGGDTNLASRLTHLPIWGFHGDNDRTVTADHSRAMISAIKEAGGNPLYTEYKGVGHNSWKQTYANPKVLKWLFGQSKKKRTKH